MLFLAYTFTEYVDTTLYGVFSTFESLVESFKHQNYTKCSVVKTRLSDPTSMSAPTYYNITNGVFTVDEHAPKVHSCGFLKPVMVDNCLAKFVGVDPTAAQSRVSLTSHVCTYIRENHLDNKEMIQPDERLSCMLGVDTPINYMQLQTLLNKHIQCGC